MRTKALKKKIPMSDSRSGGKYPYGNTQHLPIRAAGGVFNYGRGKDKVKMATFQFECPQCQHKVEADDLLRGQVATCPYCTKNIVVPREKPTSKGTREMPQAKRLNFWGKLRRCLTTKGRARRKEFWTIEGVFFIVYLLAILPSVLLKQAAPIVFMVFLLPLIVLGLASLCVWIRRLHDLDRSEWWLLALFAGNCSCRLAGIVGMSVIMGLMDITWLIVLGCLDGTPSENDYGNDPKGRDRTGGQAHVAKITIWILSSVSAIIALIAIISTTTHSPVPNEISQKIPDQCMVKVGGIEIRQLADIEFEKGYNENGSGVFTASLPEDNGFTPGVSIMSQDVNFPITSHSDVSVQQIRKLMNAYVAGTIKKANEDLKEQDVVADISIIDRSDNAVTFLVEFETHYAYQKHILDIQNERFVIVTGVWKSSGDKKIIKESVDSAHLAEP